MSTSFPPGAQGEGTPAEEAATAARRAVEEQLTAGTLDLAGLFAQVDAEGDHHVVGHMHVRAALLALPKIGDVKANEILDGLGIKHDEHIDVLGAGQRAALEEAVASA